MLVDMFDLPFLWYFGVWGGNLFGDAVELVLS